MIAAQPVMTTALRRILAFGRVLWPGVRFYDKQRDMIGSVAEDAETYVVAGNKLGKDFAAAFVGLTFFLEPRLYFPDDYVREVESWRQPGMPDHLVHTRRIVATSVKEKHLMVLWGEMGRLITTAAQPLLDLDGGPLTVNAFELRLKEEADVKKPINYMIGQVAQQGESMAGHHAAYTMFMADEASGLWDENYKQAQGWAKRMLIWSNPNPTTNFLYRAVKAGSLA